ncbi:MAG TPA: ComEC/Rec2 family competence protein [Patescibacteria group bacterium]
MTIIARMPKRFRFVCLLCGYLIGLALGSWFAWGISEYLLYGIFAFLGLSFLFRNYSLSLLFLTLACAVCGYSWSQWHLQRLTLQEPIEYTGVVEVVSVRFSQVPRQRVVVRMLDGAYAHAAIQSYVYDWAYDPGTKILIHTSIEPSDFRPNLGAGILGQATNLTIREVVPSQDRLVAFRNQVQERMGSSIPEPYASLAVGLLTGQNDSFDLHFKEDLQRTGTTHLVAVSGYNLTIVALLLQRLGRRKNRYIGYGLALSSILFYVILAGANPSILRGAMVAFLSLSAGVAGRITHRTTLVLMSAVLLSFLTPLGMLYSLSWQLSFLAFVGILFVSPVVTPYLENKFGFLGATMGETLSAELLVLPLVLKQFGVLSIVSPLVNTVVLGITPLAMALSALQATISLISLEMGRLFAWVTYPILWSIVTPIQWASKLPFASYQISSFSWLYFVVSYCLVGLLFGVLSVMHGRKTDDETQLT